MKKKLTHDDIPVFPYPTKVFDGDVWIRLTDALEMMEGVKPIRDYWDSTTTWAGFPHPKEEKEEDNG